MIFSYADPSSKIAAADDTPRSSPCLCRMQRLFVSCCPGVPDSQNIISYETAHERNYLEIRETPFHSQDGKGMDAEVLVKYFNPCGTGTWLITEAEREGDDWRLFGYCHIYEWEWGYLMLSELASLRLPFGLTIERDIYTARKYVRDFLPQDE